MGIQYPPRLAGAITGEVLRFAWLLYELVHFRAPASLGDQLPIADPNGMVAIEIPVQRVIATLLLTLESAA